MLGYSPINLLISRNHSTIKLLRIKSPAYIYYTVTAGMKTYKLFVQLD